ncbi:MAG TPA: S41 family peptidase [Chitinophagaceae bacterium]|nr:S41 family peptidase [Chitinophagaceae bacterium]
MSDAKKKFKIYLPILFAIVLVLGIFFGYRLKEPNKEPFAVSTQDHALDQILHLIDLKYVDSIQLQSIKENAIQDILKHLDPHSEYISPHLLKNVTENMQGHYRGIGVAYYIINDTINVSRVLDGGPAAKNGIKIGDQIIKANDSSLTGKDITPKRIKHILRGPNHSQISLNILRRGTPLQIELQRGVIPLKSIQETYFIHPGVAYMRINRFSAHTYSEFMDAVVALKKKDSIKKFILDLRNNPGGLVESAVNIADEFLSKNKLVVYTKGKNYPKREFTCSKHGELEDVPLAVLVDGYTASASEILAGAIQDWDRGYIIGRQTFGKGLVQEQYFLSNGSALRLTVARYYLPSGRLIQRPYKHRMLAYHHDLLRRAKHGELLHQDSIHYKDTTAYYTKKEHRLVHAKGGIMPDIFVPVDTAKLSNDLLKLYHKHTLFRFAQQYLSHHKKELTQFTSPEEFAQAHIFNENIFHQLKGFAAQSKINLNPINSDELSMIKIQIKAFIARSLWQNKGYYYLLNQDDNVIHKALNTLKSTPSLTSLG